METLWCGQSYITAIPIPIQQNNSFTHFLSYSPKITGVRHCITFAVPRRDTCLYDASRKPCSSKLLRGGGIIFLFVD